MNRIWISGVLATGLFTAPVQSADALLNHLMQIEQVIGGVNGDTTAQAIQLRMRSGLQQFVAKTRLRAWDAQGLNPILLTDFGANVLFNGCGVRILIASANFANFTNPPATPDFILTNLIPASYLAAGSITFEDDSPTVVWWRLSWGGANYTGSNAGSCTNDDSICPSPGDFGPPWPDPLPSQGVQALLFQPSCAGQSTNNAADYALTSSAAVFINNAAVSFALTKPSVADIGSPGNPGFPDGCVDSSDLTVLLGAWCSGVNDPNPPSPPCENCTQANLDLADIGSSGGGPPDGCVDSSDLTVLLGEWCSAAGGNPCGTCQ